MGWARDHALRTGHRTIEGRRFESESFDPGSCLDCPARSPMHLALIAKPEPTSAADAWDEGYEAAYGDLLDRDPHRTKNPYAQGESQ